MAAKTKLPRVLVAHHDAASGGCSDQESGSHLRFSGEKTWDVTSDAIAACFAWVLDARRFAIVTDVDGVYADGDVKSQEKLVRRTAATDLCVCTHLPDVRS